MRTAVIAVVALVWSSLAQGVDIELGVPLKRFDGLRATVVRVVPEGCWKAYYLGSLCLQNGFVFARMDIEGSEDVRFFGVNTFAKFIAGPLWSRVGVGFGLFDRKTDQVRSHWDFNLSVAYGLTFLNGIGLFIAGDHWSNGRSFASKMGLGRLWPTKNDGGNALLIGLILRF